MRYLYLHGFASGPGSFKARALTDRFQQHQITLEIPDFNEGGFTGLTLSRQIQQVQALINQTPEEPIGLIGSSFGGLTALWLAEQCPQVQRLGLLAPALGFPQSWHDRLSPDQLDQWQRSGQLMVYHYTAGKELPLGLGFWEDAQRYDQSKLQRVLPTVILHGRADRTVSIELSQQWAASHPWVELIELETDHGMGDAIEPIWQTIERFFQLLNPPQALH